MGNYCCQEPTNLGQISNNIFADAKFKPLGYVPKITNKFVQQRIIQLEENKLQIDDSKYEGIKLKGPQKETTKEFIYQGTWRDDVPQGRGSIIFSNNEFFQGEFNNGNANGKGRFIMTNGDYYEGDIVNNKASGIGKYVGSQYEFVGTWADSKPKIGKYTMKSTGTVIEMEKQHEGTIEWANGDFYHGQIENQNPNGEGKANFHNKNVYEGSWRNGTFHGHGQYYFISGQKYVGNYQNGIKHGYGVFYYLNNKRYEGDWKNGRQNGHGKLFVNNSLVYQGNFKDGEPTQQDQLDPESQRVSVSNTNFYNRDTL